MQRNAAPSLLPPHTLYTTHVGTMALVNVSLQNRFFWTVPFVYDTLELFRHEYASKLPIIRPTIHPMDPPLLCNRTLYSGSQQPTISKESANTGNTEKIGPQALSLKDALCELKRVGENWLAPTGGHGCPFPNPPPLLARRDRAMTTSIHSPPVPPPTPNGGGIYVRSIPVASHSTGGGGGCNAPPWSPVGKLV